MFDLRGARLVLLLVMWAVPCFAQSESWEAATQRARLDSLLPELRAASRELHYGDSIRQARRRAAPLALDTARFGPFVVIARDSESREHFRNFEKAVAGRAGMLRGLSSQHKVLLFVERDIGQNDVMRFRARESGGQHVRIFGTSPRRRLRFTHIAVDNAIHEFVPPAVRAWLRDAGLSKGREQAAVYRELATSPSPIVRACHKKHVAPCLSALQLAGTAPDSVALSATARASMLMHALTSADASIARLIATGSVPAATALEQASGRRLSALVQSWHEEIAGSYMSHAGLARASGAALFWSVAVLMLALRSTRRRAE